MSELFLIIDEAEEILSGDSSAAGRLRSQVERIAKTPGTTALLLGERGLEFERVARSIHLRSKSQGALLPIGCQALGAKVAQVDAFGCAGGLIEKARGGTLFLDEVADLTPPLQGDLLRSLEARLQSDEPKQGPGALAPRIVASTARDLDALVQAGEFRSDLFYRLNVLTIRVPSLRERAADLQLLAEGILRRQAARTGRQHSLEPAALERLKAHDWPGNLFELETQLAQAGLRAKGTRIEADQLLLTRPKGTDSGLLPAQEPLRSIRASEEALIRRVLAEEAGNRSSTARALGINRTTLYNKLRQYGIA